MTRIPCATGTGYFEIDDGCVRPELWHYLNADDGLGEPVDPHYLQPRHVQALGAHLSTLVAELLRRGIGVTVDVPADAYQRAAFARTNDTDGWR